MTDSNQPSPARPRVRAGLRGLLLGAAFAATFAAGALAGTGLPALALGMAMDHAGGMHGHMHGMAEAHVDKMLTEIGASADQKEKIKAIMHRGFEQVGPIHQKLESAHGDLHRILTAPTIDRAALEQLRAERVGDMDQASKVLVQTLADAAEVLTPEQRAKLAAHMAEHHHHQG